MTRTRRLLAFVLEVLLLQVTILGGGMACASGTLGRTAGVARASMSTEHADHATRHHARGGDATPGSAHAMSTAERPGTPAPQHEHATNHCLLAGGCAVIAVTSPALLVADVTVVHNAASVADEHLLRSARPAPEPPPPRG